MAKDPEAEDKMETFNYFEVLGLDPEASIGEIKKAYRKLVFEYHPDYNQSETARKRYIKITEAYKILVDPLKREEYVKGQSNAVTDEPWIILKNYWEMIYQAGFQ